MAALVRVRTAHEGRAARSRFHRSCRRAARTIRESIRSVQRIIDRAQIGIELSHADRRAGSRVARRPRPRGPRQDNAIDFLAFEQTARPALPRARSCRCPPDRVPNTSSWRLKRADIGVLRGGARPHRSLAQVDGLERRPHGFGVEFEQRSLARSRPRIAPLDHRPGRGP